MKLEWRHLQALRDLYESGRTALLLDNAFIKSVLIKKREWINPKEKAKRGYVVPREKQREFRTWYEKDLKENIDQYQGFFDETGVADDARRIYLEEDIRSLVIIKNQKDNILDDLDLYTPNSFSENFFTRKGAKYMKGNTSLFKAVLSILDISKFPNDDPSDHKWRLVVDCEYADKVVLCENVDFLRTPQKALENNIELWCVGGNNMPAIERIPLAKLELPLYYSCDWDHAGLEIYLRIKKIINSRKKEIVLLYPSAIDKRLPIDSPHHKSRWKHNLPISGLDIASFSLKEKLLINQLMTADEWIEEEANKLILMINDLTPIS